MSDQGVSITISSINSSTPPPIALPHLTHTRPSASSASSSSSSSSSPSPKEELGREESFTTRASEVTRGGKPGRPEREGPEVERAATLPVPRFSRLVAEKEPG